MSFTLGIPIAAILLIGLAVSGRAINRYLAGCRFARVRAHAAQIAFFTVLLSAGVMAGPYLFAGTGLTLLAIGSFYLVYLVVGGWRVFRSVSRLWARVLGG